MKKKTLAILIVLAIFSLLAAACTRSASGSPEEAVSEEALPNPVSTQSQLMKDIIAGTQTAMAMPVDGTPAVDEEQTTPEAEDETAVENTPAPTAKATSVPLPTSTAGPPPVVTLNFNTKKCGPNVYLCIQSFKKDQSVVVQATYPWLLNDMDLTFKIGLDGVYDFKEYIVGTAKYSPTGGQGFEVTLNIPDSLRGSETIVVLLETNNPTYYGTDFFVNQ